MKLVQSAGLNELNSMAPKMYGTFVRTSLDAIKRTRIIIDMATGCDGRKALLDAGGDGRIGELLPAREQFSRTILTDEGAQHSGACFLESAAAARIRRVR